MMDELSFSLYGTHAQFVASISPLLKEFETKYQTKIQTTELAIEEAWPQLLQYVLYGGGPDIARIGTIWTTSLVSLNALRPFKSSELASLGGENIFYSSIWQSNLLPGDPNVWAIPFTSYNYVLFYRRDLLAGAGIDETSAFSSSEAMLNTLERLSNSGVQSPWVIPSGEHFRARLHIAASWIWGANGHFLSEDGKLILLNQPEALKGLTDFFEMHRFLSPVDYGLSVNECRRRFARGQAAMFIGGPDTVHFLRNMNPAPGIIENISAAALPGVPWIGGSSLVVWKDVLAYPVKERAVNRLISFLTEKSNQIRLFTLSDVLPSRPDALSELTLDPPELLQVQKYILEKGRSYRPYSIWVRIQNDLINTLDFITAALLEDPNADVVSVIRKYIDPVVQRYKLILSAI
jgi:ABC-type glycerol-3-phosphate transport system substrate-binding protein